MPLEINICFEVIRKKPYLLTRGFSARNDEIDEG